MDVLDLVNDNNQVGPGHDFMVRPFVCNFDNCDRAFARKSDLARHFRIHTNERPFACGYRGCGKAFIQRSALTVHTRVHTGERPHHCETCNKAFADSSSLARHRRIHTGKRPYGCKVPGCGRQFARRNTYLKHFKRQHPELPPPTSNSVRALHIPNYRPSSLLSASTGSPGFPAPGSDSQDYSANSSVVGHPHAFAASHTPDGAACYGGVFLNGQLHSSQFTGPGGPARLYFHPTDPSGPGAYPSMVPHNLPGDGSSQSHQTTPSDRNHSAEVQSGHNGLGYGSDQITQNGQPVGSDYSNGADSMFTSHEATVRMNGGSSFVFLKQDPHMLRHYGTPMPMVGAPWVGGGFAPGQLAMPSQMPLPSSYHPNGQVRMESGKPANDRLCQSPLSERGASPELVDINAVPTIKFQPSHHGYSNMPFSVDPHGSMISPVTAASMSVPGGQLHAVPPHMQRFHSAPGMAINHSWSQPDPFKCSTPGFEQRMQPQPQQPLGPPQRSEEASSAQWADSADGQLMSRETSANGNDDSSPNKDVNDCAQQSKVEWGQSSSFSNAPGVVPRGAVRMSSTASTASTTSSLMNVTQTPQGLPPMSFSPFGGQQGQLGNLSFPVGHQWQQPSSRQDVMAPGVVGKPMVCNPHMGEPLDEHSITLGSPVQSDDVQRDRQLSGVSAVGLGIANVTFNEGGLDVKEEQWTPSEIGTEGGDGLESDESDADRDSDEDFLPGNSKKRGATMNGSKRGRGRLALGRPAVKQRRISA